MHAASMGHTHGLKNGDVPPVLPERIAVLRLDTDWYESTKAELEVLWPLLQPGGWLAVDDYFTWAGAQKAVDEWLLKSNWTKAAHKAGAFGPGKHNYVYKANPYDELRPFA